MINQFDNYIAKIIVIGNTDVGKTNIISRFTQNYFSSEHIATIGMDFKIKILEIQGQRLKMCIWDTAGQQKFKTITRSYYKGASGIIIVFSLQNKKSFQDVIYWLAQIQKNSEKEQIPKIFLANKFDLERQVLDEDIQEFRKQHECEIILTSAKLNKNIQQAFIIIGKQILKNINKIQMRKKIIQVKEHNCQEKKKQCYC